MATRTERRPAEVRAELQVWYLTDLRPKLASAAREGKVAPDQAATLDLQVRELLALSGDYARETA
jgi:hypothetical protein